MSNTYSYCVEGCWMLIHILCSWKFLTSSAKENVSTEDWLIPSEMTRNELTDIEMPTEETLDGIVRRWKCNWSQMGGWPGQQMIQGHSQCQEVPQSNMCIKCVHPRCVKTDERIGMRCHAMQGGIMTVDCWRRGQRSCHVMCSLLPDGGPTG